VSTVKRLSLPTLFPPAGEGRERFRCALLLIAGLLIGPPALAERVLDAAPDSYRQILRTLRPGDTLRLAPGLYQQGLPLHHLHGAADRPITITGPEAGPPAIFIAHAGRITVSLIDSSHLRLRHLRLDGGGARTHGLVAEGRGRYAHHITLEHLHISGFDAAQGFSAISTKAPAWGWIIRDNVISGVGTGMYLGDSDGGAPFVAGLIEGNRIENTLGYNLQIKHQRERPAVPGLPTTPQRTLIRHNLFSKLTGAAGEGMARPNLLLGHWPLEGPGQDDLYLVYGNRFFHNPTERLFQAEGHVAVYNNLFVNGFGEAVSFQAHNDRPRRILCFNNTILGRGPALRLAGADPRFAQRVDGNAIFAEQPAAVARLGDNFVASLERAESLLRAPFAPLETVDLSPVAGALGRTTPGIGPATGLPDADRDFSGRPRTEPRYGAHGHAPGGPRPGD